MTTDNTALQAALLDIERFVDHGGWDQPARLFALVETDALIAAEPTLASQLHLRGTADGAPEGSLTSIEQEDFVLGEDLSETLAGIAWPETVKGCALALERAFLPADADVELPEDPTEAARVVAKHPRHDEIRLVAGAERAEVGEPLQFTVARLRSAGEVLAGPDLAPHLSQALAETLGAEVAGPGQEA